MSEHDVVRRTVKPMTVQSLTQDLRRLGVEPGMVVLVHSSLNAIGWVSGGPIAVILALEEALGPEGTLVMPSHTSGLCDPSEWKNPPVPEEWWQVIRDTMPAFDPDLTPTRSMGAIAETFRKQRGVLRSSHPLCSFSAWGNLAETVVQDHELSFGMGERSPLARIYDMDGYVLLIGVDHDSNSSIHLAEYRSAYPRKSTVQAGAPISSNGAREWVTFDDVNVDSDDFDRIGEEFATTVGRNLVYEGQVGLAQCQLMPQRALVDFAVDWLPNNR